MLNRSASLAIQQAFSKPCMENLISKDTHLVSSIYPEFETWFSHEPSLRLSSPYISLMLSITNVI